MSNKVSIAKCSDAWDYETILASTRKLLEPFGGMSAFVKKGEKVILKPNICVTAGKETGLVTNPLLTKAVAVLAMESGAGEVKIKENAGVGRVCADVLRHSPTQKIADELGIPLEPAGVKCKTVDMMWHPEFNTLDVDEECYDTACLINIPVIKTHVHTNVTLSMKNLKGCLPHRSMKKMHMGGVDWGLVGLANIIKPRLNIADGTIGSDGMGPVYGDPIASNVLLASDDCLALDVVTSAVIDIPVEGTRHIMYAGEVLGRSVDYRDYEILGESIEAVKCHYEQPPHGYDNIYGSDVVEKDACTGCNANLLYVIKELHDTGKDDLLDKFTFVVGQSVEVPERHGDRKLVCVGKCLYSQREKGDIFVNGCPPPYWAVTGELFRSEGKEDENQYALNRMDIYNAIPSDNETK